MMMNQISFQDGASPLMMSIAQFHDYAMSTIALIMVFTGALLFMIMHYNTYSANVFTDDLSAEAGWTAIPSSMLILLASASLWLMYELENHVKDYSSYEQEINIKTMAHQWYWSYLYSEFKNLTFDSYMLPENSLSVGQFRLLEVDNRLIIPTNSPIRIFVSAADVLHAWTVPSLGVKADAIPGRLNVLKFSCSTPGTFYGQCSELCGANHSFMPIALEATPPNIFLRWAKSMS